ncbi:hypothetical protein ACTI_67640 [Actinoplanes sp. OR16]|uniref:hypothetical protein n=1 Tax=Actinoplanes sp. OR16 TaxID=946334 RepID=UPI000F6CF85C|nr:hypothetical protein [Actinoplanes sp. OR16]BBH70079.1 hypothetical protein ACTI_67640 [Actinoplanes sp. OR16]
MRLLTLAAGLATGYVLGARAGRERYDQIASAARKATGGPAAHPALPDTGDRKPRAAGIVESEEPVAGAKPPSLRDAETPDGPVTYTGTATH